MEKEKSLAKNIIIFAIGSFSSKLLQFLLIPFYTRVLTNSEYGTIDILQNIGNKNIKIHMVLHCEFNYVNMKKRTYV